MFPSRVIIGGLIFALVGSIITAYKLKSKLDKAHNDISVLENKLKFRTTQVALKDNIIEEQNNNIRTLAKELTTLTNKYKQFEKTYADAKAELDKWRNKKPEVKYKYIVKKVNPDHKDLTQEDCKLGIEMNKRISDIKYDDL